MLNVYYVKIERVEFLSRRRKCKTRSLVKAADAITEHWTGKELAFTDTSNMWPMLRSSKQFFIRVIVTTCPMWQLAAVYPIQFIFLDIWVHIVPQYTPSIYNIICAFFKYEFWEEAIFAVCKRCANEGFACMCKEKKFYYEKSNIFTSRIVLPEEVNLWFYYYELCEARQAKVT